MTFDLVVLIVVAVFAVWGAFAGAARQVAQIAGVVVAWIAASPVGQFFGPVLAVRLAAPTMVGVVLATFIAFLLTFLVVRAILTAFLRRLLAGRDPANRSADRALGLLLGGAKVAVIVYIGLAAATFVENNVTIAGRRLALAPKDSTLFKLARSYNIFEVQQFSGVKDYVQVARLSSDPKMAARLKDNADLAALKKDPRFAGALNSEGMRKAIESGDYQALLKSNQVLELISDPRAMRRLERITEVAQ